MNIMEAMEVLEHGQLGNCYLLSGDNSYWARQWLRLARQRFLGDGYEDAYAFKEGVKNWSELEMELRTIGFFSQRRIIVVKDAQWPKRDESLSAYLQNPDPDALLVIWDTKANASLMEIFGPKQSVELKALPSHLFQRFVQQEMKSRHLRLNSNAIGFLADVLLHDEQQVIYELDKMMLYDPKRKWDEDSVGDFVVPMPHDTQLWRLTGPLAQRDSKKTIAQTRELLREGKAPLLIFIVAIRHIIKLNHALKAKQQGFTVQQFARIEGMKEFPAKKIWQYAQYWSLKEIAELLQRAAFVDRALKTGFGDGETWVVMYMATIGGKKNK